MIPSRENRETIGRANGAKTALTATGWRRAHQLSTITSVLAALILTSTNLTGAEDSQTKAVDALIHAIRYRDLTGVKKIINSGVDLNRVGKMEQHLSTKPLAISFRILLSK